MERYGPPVRTDRPHPCASHEDIRGLLAESSRAALHLDRGCTYAACTRSATALVDGWVFCGRHYDLHQRETAA